MHYFGNVLRASRIIQRLYSTNISEYVIEELNTRNLIKVSGPDATDFLQGLITNDIHHLDNGNGSTYTLFLNNKGRVLYDSIIYRVNEKHTFLIECDTSIASQLEKYLKMYRVRRQVDVKGAENLIVHSVFNPKSVDVPKDELPKIDSKLEGFIVACDKLQGTFPEGSSFCKTFQDLTIYRDPRIRELGLRIIAPRSVDAPHQLSQIMNVNSKHAVTYRWFRYKLGVGEGVEDLPPGNCFPLEANCDYLHGISFHKGCYIGQELTARTHHTGVVRKRLMPLHFTKLPSAPPQESLVDNNVNLGKFRGMEGSAGLALLRIAEALKTPEIKIGNGLAQTERPHWWPLEVAKERINVKKL